MHVEQNSEVSFTPLLPGHFLLLIGDSIVTSFLFCFSSKSLIYEEGYMYLPFFFLKFIYF